MKKLLISLLLCITSYCSFPVQDLLENVKEDNLLELKISWSKEKRLIEVKIINKGNGPANIFHLFLPSYFLYFKIIDLSNGKEVGYYGPFYLNVIFFESMLVFLRKDDFFGTLIDLKNIPYSTGDIGYYKVKKGKRYRVQAFYYVPKDFKNYFGPNFNYKNPFDEKPIKREIWTGKIASNKLIIEY